MNVQDMNYVEPRQALAKYCEVLSELQNLEERTRLRETYAEREHKMYLRNWIYELRKKLIIN